MKKRRLPPIPSVVYGPGGPVRVVRPPRPLEDNGTPCNGLWHPDRREIHIHYDLKPEAAWPILRHEMMHMWLHDAGILFEEEELEEKICWAVANGMMVDFWYTPISRRRQTNQ